MFVALLVLIFIVLPIAELFVIIQVGGAIGVWWTIGILIADSVVGSMLLRSEGRAAWRRFNEALAAGRAPAREALDGVLVIFGGAFLITPGFLTDVVGVLLLLPPTRSVFRRWITRRGGRMFDDDLEPLFTYPNRGARSDYDVEGSAHEVDPPHLRP